MKQEIKRVACDALFTIVGLLVLTGALWVIYYVGCAIH